LTESRVAEDIDTRLAALCVFFVVALGVLILRLRDPERRRTFRAPLLCIPVLAVKCLMG
jgi:amino acid transporter